MKKRKNKSLIIFITLLILAVVLIFYIISGLNISGKAVYNGGEVTKENFPDYLEKQGIIKKLPKNAVISLKFYSEDKEGKKLGESYIIKKENVKEGEAKNPDAVLIFNSKYLPELEDFCLTMKKALENGDLSYESSMNYALLLFKYRGMLKYKKCFGV